MSRVLALILALSAAAPAAAQRFAAEAPAAAAPDAFRAEVDALRDSVADPAVSDAAVWARAQALFGAVPAVPIRVEPGLRGWDFGVEAIAGKAATIDSLLKTAVERVETRGAGVPLPDHLKRNLERTIALAGDGRVRFDDEGRMQDGQMGAYRYVRERLDSGVMEANRVMRELAALIGEPFAYATLAHEGGHHDDHMEGRLSPEKVIEGEVRAFGDQYDWLALVDPHNERLPFLRTALKNRLRRLPGDGLLGDAVKYLDHLAELRATDGDPRRIEDLVKKLGYAEGHSRGDGHGHSPTRA